MLTFRRYIPVPIDHIEKIDFQELIFAVVNWPNSEFYVETVCMYNVLLWLVCYNPTGKCFPGCGVGGFVDFDSKYKMLWGETRAHRVPMHQSITKV